MKIPYAMALLFWDCSKMLLRRDQESDRLAGSDIIQADIIRVPRAWYLPLSSSAVPQILCDAWCSARPKPRLAPRPKSKLRVFLRMSDKLLGIELRSSTFKPLDQNVGRNVALQRHVIRRFAGKIFGKAFLYSRTMEE